MLNTWKCRWDWSEFTPAMVVIYIVDGLCYFFQQDQNQWSEMVMRLKRSSSGEVTAGKCHWLALIWLDPWKGASCQKPQGDTRYSNEKAQSWDKNDMTEQNPAQRFGSMTPLSAVVLPLTTEEKQIWERVVCVTSNDCYSRNALRQEQSSNTWRGSRANSQYPLEGGRRCKMYSGN